MKVRICWDGFNRIWANCAHGPQWKWWRIVWFRIVRLHPIAPSTGYRLWIYTRWAGVTVDVFLDRRNISSKHKEDGRG
jgi:hypothetical protein